MGPVDRSPPPCLPVSFFRFVLTEGTHDRQPERRGPLNGSAHKRHAISTKSGPRCWRSTSTSTRRLILDRSTDRRWRPSDETEEDRGAIEPIGAFSSVVSYLLRLTSSARVFRRPFTRAYPLFLSVWYGITQSKRALVACHYKLHPASCRLKWL